MAQTKEEKAAYQKQWNLDNKERRKEYNKKYSKEYNKKYKDKIKENKKKYNIKNKNKIKENKKKYNIKNKNKIKEYHKQYNIKNKNKIEENRKIYNIKNKNKIRENKKKYNIKNNNKIKEYRKNNNKFFLINQKKFNNLNPNYYSNYQKNRRLNDPEFKLKNDIRSLIYSAFINNKSKKNNKTEIILNCTHLEFKLYIEKQFNNYMNWSNHGSNYKEYNKTWQLDHIVPISIAKNEKQIILLNNYLNFRPFCSKLNNEKRNFIDYELINLNKNLVQHLLINKNELENILDFNYIL